MQSGPDNQQVNLTPPVPVVIIYLTAVVEEDGEVYFFDDIYGHDASSTRCWPRGRLIRDGWLPAAYPAHVHMNKIGLGVIAHAPTAQ